MNGKAETGGSNPSADEQDGGRSRTFSSGLVRFVVYCVGLTIGYGSTAQHTLIAFDDAGCRRSQTEGEDVRLHRGEWLMSVVQDELAAGYPSLSSIDHSHHHRLSVCRNALCSCGCNCVYLVGQGSGLDKQCR